MKSRPILQLLFTLLACYSMHAQRPEAIAIDSLITSDPPQRIYMARISQANMENYRPDIVIATESPLPASEYGRISGAHASINGSFFNTITYEMVSYYENDNLVISRNAISNGPSLLNGIIIIDSNNKLSIEYFSGEPFYESSLLEKEALVSGPILLLNGSKTTLPERPEYVDKKHPRSCLCDTGESFIMITIDGRDERAMGMTLPEVQEFLTSLGCRNAINLDGGGSTSLWVKGMGVLNNPSDAGTERKVANAIVLLPAGL